MERIRRWVTFSCYKCEGEECDDKYCSNRIAKLSDVELLDFLGSEGLLTDQADEEFHIEEGDEIIFRCDYIQSEGRRHMEGDVHCVELETKNTNPMDIKYAIRRIEQKLDKLIKRFYGD